jgi:hypothetical protein
MESSQTRSVWSKGNNSFRPEGGCYDISRKVLRERF